MNRAVEKDTVVNVWLIISAPASCQLATFPITSNELMIDLSHDLSQFKNADFIIVTNDYFYERFNI